MSDVKDSEAIEAPEEAFEAPEKGSADELLDARARRPARPDAPLRGARHGRGRPRPVPGDEAGHRAGDPGRLLLRLPARPAAQARGPREDRGPDGGEREGRPPVRPARAAAGGGAGLLRASATSRSRSRSSTTSPTKAKADGAPMPPTTRLRARPVRRPLHGAARREHGQDRAVQAPRGLRRVLARRPEAARAPADLRHGLVDAGGARHLPLAARGGEEAGPPQAGRPARPVLVPRRVAGRRLLAPEGLAAVPDAARRDAREPGEARLPGDLHAAARPPQALGAVGPLGPLPRLDVPRRRRRRDVQPQADELPRVDVHLPLQGALVPRPAAAAVASTACSTAASGAACSAA